MRDREIWITGASRGLGYALAEHYRTGNNLVVDMSRASVDLSKPDEVASLTVPDPDTTGCDILINNAAVLTSIPLGMMRDTDLLDMVNVNLVAPMLLTRRVIFGMMRRKWGRIINITSMATKLCVPGDSVYAATKAGLETFTRVVNKEVHRYGITVNCIAVSAMETDMLKAATKGHTESVLPLIPHGAFATVESVIGAIDYLCEADDVGGQTIYLGGV